MRRTAQLAALQEQKLDRLEDLASTLAALRKAVAQGDRATIETYCWMLARRLAAAPLGGDDQDEIRATLEFVEARVKFGVHQRLRRMLLPLLAAIEGQIEEAEKEL